MVNKIDYTILSDGSSDRVLVSIIDWLIKKIAGEVPVNGSIADLSRLRNPPKELPQKIAKAIEFNPCDILFVHRDAEAQKAELRYTEINKAIHVTLKNESKHTPHICIVPIRMTESWLLIDRSAICKAAGNPHYSGPLKLPDVKRLENVIDPKETLFELLRTACDLTGRHLRRFDPEKLRHLVAENIVDFSALRTLSAFKRLENDVSVLLLKETIQDQKC
jgi:hypothetical protein